MYYLGQPGKGYLKVYLLKGVFWSGYFIMEKQSSVEMWTEPAAFYLVSLLWSFGMPWAYFVYS